MNTLQQLRSFSQIVADSSHLDELESIRGLFGVTTNPTLIMQAIEQDSFIDLIYEACNLAQQANAEDASETDLIAYACDATLALIGSELHRLLGVQVSLEVDARLAGDAAATAQRGERIARLCADFSIPSDKLLIKVAATPAGIEAVRQLQNIQINCNVTLVFCLEQAIAAAGAGAWLVSPFVGRVSDWYKVHKPDASGECPGVELVRNIQGYFRQFRYATKVMGASFRNTDQILQLAGTDLLTISPTLLDELQRLDTSPTAYTAPSEHKKLKIAASELKQLIEKNPMAHHLLDNGIKRFIADQERLDKLLLTQLKP